MSKLLQVDDKELLLTKVKELETFRIIKITYSYLGLSSFAMRWGKEVDHITN